MGSVIYSKQDFILIPFSYYLLFRAVQCRTNGHDPLGTAPLKCPGNSPGLGCRDERELEKKLAKPSLYHCCVATPMRGHAVYVLLLPTTQSQCRSHNIRLSPPQNCPSLRCQTQVKPQLISTSDQLDINSMIQQKI